MKMYKRWACLLLGLVLLLCALPALAQTDAAALAGVGAAEADQEEESQFPFLAQTGKSAVNVREEATTKGKRVRQLERGAQVTVCAAELSDAGEVWYQVELEDGTAGYIRSDLLSAVDETQAAPSQIKEAAYSGNNPSKGQSETASSVKESSSTEYIGNRNTKKFHRTSCHTLPAEKNRVYFSSRDKATSSGYVPCKNCNP